jgi:hypothetical protein
MENRVFLLLIIAITCVACTLTVSVGVDPVTAGVEPGGTVQFHAVVSGGADSTVTWSVQEGSTGGTVTSSGLYTAPWVEGTYHVVAAATAKPSETAVATVTVAIPAVSVSLTPSSAVTFTGSTVQFSATVSGSVNKGVTWSVREGTAGGSITAGGLYTAPAAWGTYHVVAASTVNPAVFVEATVSVYILAQHAGTITADETWQGTGTVHAVIGDVLIEGNATVTILPDAVIMVDGAHSIKCGQNSAGALVAVGTVGEPILFTSLAATSQPGDWYGLRFYSYTLPATKLQFCIVEYAGGSTTYPGNIYIRDCGVEIRDCVIRFSKTSGIDYYGTGHVTGFTGNTITGCLVHPLQTLPQYVSEIGLGNNFTGNTTDGIGVNAGTVTASATWRNLGVPYCILGDLTIGDAAGQPVLTLEPGTVFKMNAGTCIRTGYSAAGDLVAAGTAFAPILFSSAVATPAPGNWDGLRFQANTGTSSELQYCTVEYAGGTTTYPGAIYVDGTSVGIRNCTIRFSKTSGVQCTTDGYLWDFSSNTVTSCRGLPLQLNLQNLGDIGDGNALTGNVTDGIGVNGGTVDSGLFSSDITWKNLGIPYIVSGNIDIQRISEFPGSPPPPPIVTIQPGTVLRFKAHTYLRVGYQDLGGLVAIGTQEEPIRFTSDDAAPVPGDWYGLRFYGFTHVQTQLQHCTIEYGGYSSTYPGNIYINGFDDVFLSSCTIRKSKNWGIYRTGATFTEVNKNLFLTDNSFADNASGSINK